MRSASQWLVLLLALVCGPVFAADTHAGQGEAYTHCLENAAKWKQLLIDQGYTNYASYTPGCQFADRQGFGEPNDQYVGYISNGGSPYWQTTYEANHQFPRAAKCSVQQSFYAGYYTGSPKYCLGGCEYTVGGPILEDRRITDSRNSANVINFKRGSYVPSGQVCGGTNAPSTPPPPKDDYCAPLDGGYKMCANSKGDPCVVSGKTGRTYCGTKDGGLNGTNPERTENVTAGPTGPTPGTPPTPPTPRDGENWQQDRTIQTTNITNNVTQNVSVSNNAGTPNTSPGSGQPGDGSDNPGKGEDDGDDDKGSQVSGGACDVGYTCTGGDAALCAILKEQHQQRCAGDKSKEQLTADAGQGVEEGGTSPGDFFIDGTMPTLDTSRFGMSGGELFPHVEIEGQTWAPPPMFFTVIDAIKAIIIAIATIYARFVVGK